MNKLWQQLAIATNWPILAAVGVLSTLGALSIWADDRSAGSKQLAYLAIATGCMLAFQAVSYVVIGRWAWPFYIFSLSLVGYTLIGAATGGRVPFVHNTKGVYAWINFGSVSLEPSELVKIGFILVTARYLRFRSNYRQVLGLIPPFLLAMVPVAMILKQPDLGVATLFLPTLLAMLFVAGAKVRHMLTVMALGVCFLPIFWFGGPRYSDMAQTNRDPSKEIPLLKYLPSLMKEYQRNRVKNMFSHSSAAGDYQQPGSPCPGDAK